jgi:hypothetical protein
VQTIINIRVSWLVGWLSRERLHFRHSATEIVDLVALCAASVGRFVFQNGTGMMSRNVGNILHLRYETSQEIEGLIALSCQISLLVIPILCYHLQ